MQRRIAPFALALLTGLLGCGRSELDMPDDDVPPVDVPDVRDVRDVPDAPDGGCRSDSECDDNRFCNGQERCLTTPSGGICAPGTPPVCDDGVACTQDVCDDGVRACLSRPNDMLCGGATCDPMRGCVTDQCRGDFQCDNGDPCDGAERCLGGRCQRGAPMLCDDGIACTTDTCVTGRGCASSPDSRRCDDNVFCNGAEQCVASVGCVPGRPVFCDDGNPCTTDTCSERTRACTSTATDADGDGFAPSRCPGGADCDDSDARVNPRATELCTDGRDNNCNGLVDCRDPVCASTDVCRGCVPTGPEGSGATCTDGRDNDCNGLTDCRDAACVRAPACVGCVPTGPEGDRASCTDGRDNDCNGFADCRDGACRTVPECFTCVATGPENNAAACADGRDNDCDGAIDCADAECAVTPACSTVPNDVCERATRITVPGRAAGTTAMARDDYTPGCGSSGASDVAYVFVNPTRQTLVIDTIGSSYDTVLGVYRAACTPASLVRCDDDGAGMGVSSRVVLTDAEPGTYFIVVDGWSSSSGPFQLNVSVGLPENCANGVDDDGDGLIDCGDSDCRMEPRCFMCMPTGREADALSCRDGRDNDCDGLFDCADPECGALPVCCVATGPEAGFMACFDGRDNDCNGRTDCDDPQCASQPMCCRATGPENSALACADGRDNDCNGRIDCADPGCATQPRCCVATGAENTPVACSDGRDNDCDGAVDCADSQCAGMGMCPCVPSPEVCNNGRDDDCNGLVDCADARCAMAPNCVGCTVTGDEASTTQCTDGRDNDCDGATDCADALCAAVQGCAPAPPNDTCRAPLTLMVPSTVTGTTVGANNDASPNTSAAGCAGGAGGDVVYTFTLRTAATVSIDTAGSDFDTVLYVRRADCLAGAQVACNDDTGGLSSSVTFGASPGTYYVFVDGFGVDSRGSYVLSIRTSAATEVCDNRLDDDGDGLIDCADSDCATSPVCRCVPAPETTAAACADGRDNDCDGATDCADTNCRPFPMCCMRVALENNARTCTDGIDDDCDGLTDCADPECSALPMCCRPTGPELCTDGRDNDCNGLIDCADTRCAILPLCCRVTGAEGDVGTCADGRDNDCDGTTDCADPGCAAVSTCCRATMTRETGVSACTNGRDDDCDGVADCADSDCHPSTDPNAECCNGRDDNRNGVIDEFSCACEGNTQCATVGVGGPFPSNTCWSTTFRVCAPRCDLLGGNSFCNSFFTGTRCNPTTGECVR